MYRININHFDCSRLLKATLLGLFFLNCIIANSIHAQPQPGQYGGNQLDMSEIFIEDKSSMRNANQEALNKLLTPDERAAKDGFAVKAPSIKGGRKQGELFLDRGAVISGGNYAIEAKTATVRPNSRESYLYDYVAASMPGFKFKAGNGYVDLLNETAVFNEVSMKLIASRIGCDANELYKYSEDEFHFKDMTISSCNCDDLLLEDEDVAKTSLYLGGFENKIRPWSIAAREGDLTREGYAFLEDVSFQVYDVPVFYLPYFVFPLKTQRASGLLVPSYGISNQNGFQYRQPIFVALDDSSDLLLTPFIETETRVGSRFQYRELFSENHYLNAKFLYSDESSRNGESRGLVNIDPNEIDDSRYGAYVNQNYNGNGFNFLTDIHYVSDDYLLREIGDNDIGVVNIPFTSSRVEVGAETDNFRASVGGEYNQSLIPSQDDDEVLQRLPEVNLAGNSTFRPFGVNKFGLKTTVGSSVNYTKFDRNVGYTGDRMIFSPTLDIPFRYENYFSSNLGITGTYANYRLGNFSTDDEFSTSVDRTTAVVNYSLGTSFERVGDLESEWLRDLTSLGVKSQDARLGRIKQTIDPFISYIYAPDTDDGIPLFDVRDRIRKRNLVTYGMTFNVLGRFNPTSSPFVPMDDLYSRPDNYDTFAIDEMVPNYALSPFRQNYNLNPSQLGKRDVRNLMSITVRQSYDLLGESISTEDPDDLGSFTDMGVDAVIDPNKYFRFIMESNISKYTQTINSWAGGVTLFDDRNDMFDLRYTYIDPNDVISDAPEIKNLLGNLEIKLTDRTRFAYNTSYDIEASEIIRQLMAVKYIGDCDCWSVDFGYLEGTNPNAETFTMRINLMGIGDINQDIYNRVISQDQN